MCGFFVSGHNWRSFMNSQCFGCSELKCFWFIICETRHFIELTVGAPSDLLEMNTNGDFYSPQRRKRTSNSNINLNTNHFSGSEIIIVLFCVVVAALQLNNNNDHSVKCCIQIMQTLSHISRLFHRYYSCFVVYVMLCVQCPPRIVTATHLNVIISIEFYESRSRLLWLVPLAGSPLNSPFVFVRISNLNDGIESVLLLSARTTRTFESKSNKIHPLPVPANCHTLIYYIFIVLSFSYVRQENGDGDAQAQKTTTTMQTAAVYMRLSHRVSHTHSNSLVSMHFNVNLYFSMVCRCQIEIRVRCDAARLRVMLQLSFICTSICVVVDCTRKYRTNTDRIDDKSEILLEK